MSKFLNYKELANKSEALCYAKEILRGLRMTEVGLKGRAEEKEPGKKSQGKRAKEKEPSKKE